MAGSTRRGRGARALRPRLFAVVGLVATIVATAGCGGSDQVAPANVSAPRPVTGADCGSARSSLGCADITVGRHIYRYSVYGRPEGSAASAPLETVLVDLGGPGRALFANTDLLTFSQSWPSEEALLFVEEPWVTRPASENCASSLSTFYRSLRGADSLQQRAASRLVDACRLDAPGWGWTPGAYARVVDAIAAKERLELVGVVGTSYGAVRTESLWSRPSLRWLILNSPAPAAASGAAYLSARRDAVLASFARACRECRDAQAAGGLVSRAIGTLDQEPVELSTRTPEVAGVDLAAALVALTHLPPAERTKFAAGLRRPIALADSIGRLSDATLLRYGEYDMSPAMLPYFEEVCGRYGPWPTSIGSDPVGTLLAALHQPCRTIDRLPAAAHTAAPASVCIAHGGQDLVTPRAFAEQWVKRFPGALVVDSPQAAHAVPELASRCKLALDR